MRGSIADLFGVMIIAAIAITVLFTTNLVYSEFRTSYNATRQLEGGLNPTEENIIIQGSTTQNVLAGIIPFIIIGSGLAAVVLAYFIPTHPVFLPLAILVYVTFVIISGSMGNFYWEFVNTGGIQNVANNFPLVVGLIRFFPQLIAILGALILIVQYGRAGRGQGFE